MGNLLFAVVTTFRTYHKIRWAFLNEITQEDKEAKRKELKERYPKCESLINFLCCCNSKGEPRPNIQLVINSSKYMRDFIEECPRIL